MPTFQLGDLAQINGNSSNAREYRNQIGTVTRVFTSGGSEAVTLTLDNGVQVSIYTRECSPSKKERVIKGFAKWIKEVEKNDTTGVQHI